MKRKYLSALLMGVLTVTSVSTFTSCKDYDDDIANLQEQIDKAALTSDVEALKTQLQTAAATASKAAEDAQSALTKAGTNETAIAGVKTTAEKAATDVATALANAANAQSSADDAASAAKAAADAAKTAQTTADQAVKDAADAAAAAGQVSKDLKDALANMGQYTEGYMTAKEVEAKLDSISEVINQSTTDSIAKLTKVVNGYKGGINALYTAVTEVSLVGSFTNGQFISVSSYVYGEADENGNVYGNGYGTVDSYPFNLWFKTGKTGENDFTFGKNQKDNTSKNANDANNPYTYAKDTQIDFPRTIVVRINPVNAVVTPDMIKLIDSKGNNLDKVLEVKSVTKYDKLLTRAGETGLWTVELGIAKGCSADKVAQKKDGANILYALAVNNTASQAEAVADAANRYVVSTYDITLPGTYSYNGAYEPTMAAIQVKSETQQPTWTNLADITGRGDTHITRNEGAKALVAANGETISVRFNTKDYSNAANIDRFYIVRDDNNAETTSSPSEINVWKSYQYSQSLGDIVEVKNGEGVAEFTATIPSNLATGDEIAFRIFAVNYDGTLVCPTGESFNVKVVNPQNVAAVTGEIVATSTLPSTGWLKIDNVETLANDGKTLPSTVTVKVNNTNWTLKAEYATDAAGKQDATVAKDAKYVKFTLLSNIKSWKDGATGEGNITTTDNDGVVVSNISVKLTKKLPTDADAKELGKYTWKGEQLKNGVFTAYLFSKSDGSSWISSLASGDNNGYKDMDAVLNGFKNTNLEFVIANAAQGDADSDGKWAYDKALEVKGTSCIMKVSNEKATKGDIKELIDGTTEHATTIRYNFGPVSSETNDNIYGTVSEIKTVFACPLTKTAQTYEWAQYYVNEGTSSNPKWVGKDINYLTYGSSKTAYDVEIGDYIKGTNAFDATKFNGVFNTTSSKTGLGALYTTVTPSLVTKSNGVADYFNVAYTSGKLVFTPKSGASNPVADVPSTLVLKVKDAFGHEMTYEFDFTVKRAQ